jgi:hypothetical protein
MASSSNGSWETDLRDSVRTNFGQGWLVNGEASGKTKILYVYNEGLGKANKRTSVTLPIKWNVNAVLDAFHYRGKFVRAADKALKEARKGK